MQNHPPTGQVSTDERTGGTPEETGLTIRLLQDEWIIENGTGESVGAAKDREDAVAMAVNAARTENASVISVLGEDGEVERTIKVPA
jgi:hypothetical protein